MYVVEDAAIESARDGPANAARVSNSVHLSAEKDPACENGRSLPSHGRAYRYATRSNPRFEALLDPTTQRKSNFISGMCALGA